jgi:enterochelin esterase family protein
MKNRSLILLVTMAAGLLAQPGRGPAVRSPEVSADGKVTFRLRAPNAKEVAVTGIGQRLAMQKDDQGIWSATTDVLQPDLYTYAFSVDGATVNDPANGLFKTSYGTAGQSMVRVPGAAPWNPTAGPKGAVTHHFYHSALVGDDRDYFVYTPPNYDAKRKAPYPVLFLLHGLGDDASGWITAGAANVILDNLINSGKAKPMIMVNTLGYGTTDGPRGAMGAEMIPTFAKALVEEVMPQVEKSYNAAKDRNNRAIAGLSMGGAESVYTGFHYVDRFAYIGSFSGAFVMWPRANPAPAPAPGAAPGGGRGPRAMEEADFTKNLPDVSAKVNGQLKLVWIACGTEDSLNGVNNQLKAWLKARDIKFTGLEIPGFAHVWPLWRRNLAELAPQLFQ